MTGSTVYDAGECYRCGGKILTGEEGPPACWHADREHGQACIAALVDSTADTADRTRETAGEQAP